MTTHLLILTSSLLPCTELETVMMNSVMALFVNSIGALHTVLKGTIVHVSSCARCCPCAVLVHVCALHIPCTHENFQVKIIFVLKIRHCLITKTR